jgi:hypothetical protein
MRLPPRSEPLTATIARGAGAGTVGTLAMSAVMLAAGELGFHGKQPPEAIVEDAFDAADVDRSERTENIVASVAHLGFGASMGALFALARRWARTPGPEPLHGIGWGLAVWAASYQGWLPALGILPPASRDDSDRPPTMIAAHLVYGSVLGGVFGRLNR